MVGFVWFIGFVWCSLVDPLRLIHPTIMRYWWLLIPACGTGFWIYWVGFGCQSPACVPYYDISKVPLYGLRKRGRLEKLVPLAFFGFQYFAPSGLVFVWIGFLGLKPQANFALPLWGWGLLSSLSSSGLLSCLASFRI
jgi:hypothetical protein